MSSVMTKFHLDGLPFGAVLHRFTGPDLGDPHDHPWPFRSFILSGGYVEAVYSLKYGYEGTRTHPVGASFFVPASHIHRIIHLIDDECWTLILPGEPERTPGFYRWVNGEPQHRFWDQPWPS